MCFINKWTQRRQNMWIPFLLTPSSLSPYLSSCSLWLGDCSFKSVPCFCHLCWPFLYYLHLLVCLYIPNTASKTSHSVFIYSYQIALMYVVKNAPNIHSRHYIRWNGKFLWIVLLVFIWGQKIVLSQKYKHQGTHGLVYVLSLSILFEKKDHIALQQRCHSYACSPSVWFDIK